MEIMIFEYNYIYVSGDSWLVIKQFIGEYKFLNPNIQINCKADRRLLQIFVDIIILHVPYWENDEGNDLAY